MDEASPDCVDGSTVDQKDIYLLQNDKAAMECIPLVLSVIVTWSCNKKPNETFHDVIVKNSKNHDKKYVKKNLEKLQETSPNSFDVTFLYSLLPHLSNHVCKTGTDPWKEKIKDTMSLEYLLKEAKEMRNLIAHEVAQATSPSMIDKIEINLMSLLRVAGSKFKVSQKEIEDIETNLKIKLLAIRQLNVDDFHLLSRIKEKLERFGWEEMKASWESNRMHVRLPLRNDIRCKRTAIFYNLNMSIANQSTSMKKESFPCTLFFQKTSERFKIIEGVPGSGKTTLMCFFMDYWFKLCDSSWSFPELSNLQIILLIECNSIAYCSIEQLLKEKLPKTLGHLPEKEIVEAIAQLNVGFLIDGYDEVNSHSKKLIWQLFDKSKSISSWLFIISSRPRDANHLADELAGQNLPYELVTLEPITDVDEKRKFITKYHKKVRGLKVPELSRSSKHSLMKILQILDQPVLLALFCVAYKENKSFVQNWTCEYDIFASFCDMITKEIGKRIADDGIQNADVRAAEVMDAVGKLSLDMKSRNLSFMQNKDYIAFSKKCEVEISKDINYKKILSCIFTNEGNIYSFFHMSLQEFFSARYLCQQLAIRVDPSVAIVRSKVQQMVRIWSSRLFPSTNVLKSLLEEEHGFQISSNKMHSLINILKYLVLELHCCYPGIFEHYVNDLCHLFGIAKVGFRFCLNLISSTKNNSSLIKRLAHLIKEDDVSLQNFTTSGRTSKRISRGWYVFHTKELETTTEILKVSSPNYLHVDLKTDLEPSDDEILPFIETVTKHFRGNLSLRLKYSYHKYIPVDEVVNVLKNTRCIVDSFIGHLSSSQAYESLSQIPHIGSLHLSIQDPSRHSLHLLNKVPYKMWIRMPYSDTEILNQPLPMLRNNRPSGLALYKIPKSSEKSVAKMITRLCPIGGRFDSLLLHHCNLSDKELKKLAELLINSGIRTNNRPVDKPCLVFRCGDGEICTGCDDFHTNDAKCYSLALHSKKERYLTV